MRMKLPAGTTLFRQGEASRYAYRILAGDAEVTHELDGAPRTIGAAKAGELVGEIGALVGAPRNATVRFLDAREMRPRRYGADEAELPGAGADVEDAARLREERGRAQRHLHGGPLRAGELLHGLREKAVDVVVGHRPVTRRAKRWMFPCRRSMRRPAGIVSPIR